ncbi:MAG: hypothetical protein IJ612_03625, partial [Prevotella sp.]|nr:hypothetical protein [Prevotella sp.]
ALPPHIYKEVLRKFCYQLDQTGQKDDDAMRDYPSMIFGLETALLSFERRVESFLPESLLRLMGER